MANTQLPAELDAEILWDQHSALIGDDLDDLSYWSGRDVMKKEDFLKAITEYAAKLHEASALLKNVFTRYGEIHEWDRKIFNEIKTFLDGK